jgi:hypothetical protein
MIKKYKGETVGRKQLKQVIQFMLYSSVFLRFWTVVPMVMLFVEAPVTPPPQWILMIP